MGRLAAPRATRSNKSVLPLLVVADEGVEVSLLAAQGGCDGAHVCQTWCPVLCWCGRVHQVDDACAVGVLVALWPNGITLQGARRRLALLPATASWSRFAMPVLLAREGAPFSRWAGHLVSRLARPAFS